LGWSGDNVFGHARAGFGAPEEGYKQLLQQVAAVKPTVILLAYGTNEAFEGSAKLPQFVAGLNRLLDDLSATKPRIALFTPPLLENLGPPLPDPAAQNERLREYGRAMARVAEERNVQLVDLGDLLGGTSSQTGPLTDNSMHWTRYGYWHASGVMAQGLGLPMDASRVIIDVASQSSQVDNAFVSKLMVQDTRVAFEMRSKWLPRPLAPMEQEMNEVASATAPKLLVRGLAPGDYELKIDAKLVLTATAEQWAQGVAVTAGPDLDQVESLRQAIVAKNRLFFYRWRPQNETYLFGFRKHEQGQNAKEITQFDPLVAEQEARIRKLAKPQIHQYELLKR
ncbi:MAG: hypothetical protein HUU55_11905, partial [Myxococcales bacterium]|nr:hypothetical protein [Myxococcales bacterium]